MHVDSFHFFNRFLLGSLLYGTMDAEIKVFCVVNLRDTIDHIIMGISEYVDYHLELNWISEYVDYRLELNWTVNQKIQKLAHLIPGE